MLVQGLQVINSKKRENGMNSFLFGGGGGGVSPLVFNVPHEMALISASRHVSLQAQSIAQPDKIHLQPHDSHPDFKLSPS